MTVTILDSLSLPSQAQLSAAQRAGYAAWAGYIGGPSAAGTWPPTAFAAVAQAGLDPIGFWVGLGDPALAAQAARTAGLPLGSVVGHDVETAADVAGLTASVAAAFSAALRTSGYRPVLYGLPDLCALRGSAYDATWVAGGESYRSGTPIQTDPHGLANTSTQMAWQWWGTHDFHGIGVDESIADDWFAAGEEMTLDHARLHVWEWYTLYCGRIGSQSEVDFWAQKLISGENVEAVIGEFYGTPEATAYRNRPITSNHTHTVSGTLTTTTSPPTT